MKLVINADDFGYTPAVSAGIVEGVRQGIIRSTTVLCNSPDLQSARKLAKTCPELGFGVHLTLTLGTSLTGGTSFTDADGRFLSRKEIAVQPLDENEVYAEWKAQIERFIDVFDARPTHLDSHHSVHDMNEIMLRITQRLAQEYELSFRRGSRYQFVPGFYGSTVTREALIQLLSEHLNEDIEIMTHPGFCDLTLYRESSYSWQRVQELDVLCSQEVQFFVQEKGIELEYY